MSLDLELILVIGTAVTGLIWAADAAVRRTRRREQWVAQGAGAGAGAQAGPATGEDRKEPWYVEYSRSFFPVLLIVLLLRSFVAEPFRIPSGSMMPTLLVGDFILVNKFAYGLRLPVVYTELLEMGEPSRGDVAVFRFPKNPSEDYIKRIVGLPGDHIAYYDKKLYVNGQLMEQEPIGIYRGEGSGRVMNGARRLEEHLDPVVHDILIRPNHPNVEGDYRVPEGHYFVLGDNRDNSNDSRFWGFVPEDYLVGKAFVIWMNWDMQAGDMDLSRIGETIE